MNESPKIAVLGGGNGACALAGDLALAGFEVNLCEMPEFSYNIRAIQEGGLWVGGASRTGLAKLNMIGTDVRKAIEETQLIMIACHAAGHRLFAEMCAPHLEKGQIIVLNPGSQFGALEVAKALKAKGVDVINDVILGETFSLIYLTRKYGLSPPQKVWIRNRKDNMPFAAFPSKNTEKALKVINRVYPEFVPARDVLFTGLHSPNCIGHVPLIVLNAVAVEKGGSVTDGYYSKAVRRVKENLYKEHNAVADALKVEQMSYEYMIRLAHPSLEVVHPYADPLYGPERSDDRIFEKPADCDWPAELRAESAGKGTLNMRYITEDIPYGLVPIASFGEMLKVPTPTIDAMIVLASEMLDTDYRIQSPRTVEKLGLSEYTVSEIHKLVTEGER